MQGSSKNLHLEIAVLRSDLAACDPLSMPSVSVGEDRPMKQQRGGMSQPPDPRDNSLFAALPQSVALVTLLPLVRS